MNRYAGSAEVDDHSGKLASTADSGLPRLEPIRPPNVSQFRLMVPTHRSNHQNEEAKLSPADTSTNRSNILTQRQVSIQLQQQTKKQKEIQALIRQQSKKHNMEFIFAALDVFVQEFMKPSDKESDCSLLPQNSDALFAQLRIDFKNILSVQEDEPNSQHSISNTSTINRKLLGQLYTIQELRDYIDQLEQQIKEIERETNKENNNPEGINFSPHRKLNNQFTYPENSADNRQPFQSIVKGTILKGLQSPDQNTFNRQNFESFAEIKSIDGYPLNFRQEMIEYSQNQYTKKSLHMNDLRSPLMGNHSIINQINQISTPFNAQAGPAINTAFQHLSLSGPTPQYSLTLLPQPHCSSIFSRVTSLYKRLIRRYLQSLNTSYKMFVKLVGLAKRSLNKVFIQSGKQFLMKARTWLDDVCVWYSSFQFPVKKNSFEEAESFMIMCENNIKDLPGIRCEIDTLIAQLKC